MAFASVGTLGSTVTPKSSGTTQLLAVSSAVEVGNVVLLGSVWDNAGTSQADTSQLSVSADAGSNTWIKLGERTTSAGAANDGCVAALWVSKITTQLNASDTITVASTSARTAKATGAWEFTASGGTLTFGGAGFFVTGSSSTAADPASQTLSSLTSREYLFCHVVGAGDGGTTNTPSTNYTEAIDTETTGGSVATNVGLHLEFRILTGTGDTVDVASTTDRKYAQVFAAVYEAAGAAATSLMLPNMVRSVHR